MYKYNNLTNFTTNFKLWFFPHYSNIYIHIFSFCKKIQYIKICTSFDTFQKRKRRIRKQDPSTASGEDRGWKRVLREGSMAEAKSAFSSSSSADFLFSFPPSFVSLNPSRQPSSLLSHATPVVRRLEEGTRSHLSRHPFPIFCFYDRCWPLDFPASFVQKCTWLGLDKKFGMVILN